MLISESIGPNNLIRRGEIICLKVGLSILLFPSIVFSNFTFRSRPYSQGYLLPVHSPMLMPRGQKKKKTSLDRAIYSILSAQQIKSIIDLNSQSDIKRRNYLIRRNKFSTNAGNYLKRSKNSSSRVKNHICSKSIWIRSVSRLSGAISHKFGRTTRERRRCIFRSVPDEITGAIW